MGKNRNTIKRKAFQNKYEWMEKKMGWILTALPIIGVISTFIFRYSIRIWMLGKAKYFSIPEDYIVINYSSIILSIFINGILVIFYMMWTIWNVREVLRQKKLWVKLIVIMILNFLLPILILTLMNFLLVKDRVWGKEFIKLSIQIIIVHGELTIGIGFCLFHFLQNDLIHNKKLKGNRKKAKSYKLKNRDYRIIGGLLIVFAIGIEICFMHCQGENSAQNQMFFSVTQINGVDYAVVMSDGESVVLKKCQEENGILKISKEGSRKENCNGLWITEKRFKGNEIVGVEWEE